MRKIYGLNWLSRLANPLSPTGTWEGDIHMRYDSRMVVDEYAKVVTIPFG